jgi:2-oxoglutarate/2-oxoacid ferredoxin oxidoreductase subunit alpha
LPTRTEQGDLELALYSGHGEFPRILLAPGTLKDGFELTAKAFNLADKFQVPVIILTDQYYMDSYYNTEAFDADSLSAEKYITETDADYVRYELTEDGISPRGVPGFGKGLVCVDSDEHTQDGHITEDFDLRIKMMDKRLKKLDLIREQSMKPDFYGSENYKNLIICWGSTVNIVREAVMLTDNSDTAVLHFTQIYPLHATAAELISKAKSSIVVENNATGQFAKLILLETGIKADHKILKYDGLSFAADRLAAKLSELIKEGE